MSEIVIRNVDQAVLESLERRAAAHGCSLDEEIRNILNAAAAEDGLGSDVAALFHDTDFPQSVPLRQQSRVAVDFRGRQFGRFDDDP